MSNKADHNNFINKKVKKSGRDLQEFFHNPFKGLKRVRDEQYAFYCESSAARAIIPKLFEPHEICDTKEIFYQNPEPIGIVIKKHSPLRELLLLNWIRMYEYGTFNKNWRHWNHKKPPCVSASHFESVRLEYDAPIFMLLAVSYLISLLILVLEFNIAYFRRKRKIRNKKYVCLKKR